MTVRQLAEELLSYMNPDAEVWIGEPDGMACPVKEVVQRLDGRVYFTVAPEDMTDDT